MRKIQIMFYITTTRFNNETFLQNRNYCINHNGLYYGSPTQVKENIKPNANIIVIEMNNTKNKIMGIGLVKNEIRKQKQHKIYEDQNYNRFTYIGKIRIDSEEITNSYDKQVLAALENLFFKGATHLKRAQGITELPNWILKNKANFDVKLFFKTLFLQYKDVKI